ncbi:tyrosine-protein phosphatase [Ornithinibacillus californiensis]|uniref:tyrosine-protein phosphatase n=1 Tax=Ornithinibacillus californiensis TaxID=161536 RepID=UPI00064DB420|nr:CpsB/CapC family capsule biosynthesis tyrosine phosphatase [Ornithinibacillus californiensis]
MIDIHSHILPGIDDGAKTMTDSLVMAQAAVKQGIHTIIATPHHQNGQYINEKQDIKLYVDQLNENLQEANIPLTVLVGQETRINGDMIEELQSGVIATLNNTKYVFVEFPSGEVPRYSEQMLFDIQVAGYTPIIVHPERNRQIAEHPSILFNFVQKGALTQVTAASLVGKFGKTIQKLSHQLVDHNLTHFIASDAHNTTTRGFVMQEAYQILKQEHGNSAFYMFMENAQLLIDGQYVHRNEPERIQKKKKIFGLF